MIRRKVDKYIDGPLVESAPFVSRIFVGISTGEDIGEGEGDIGTLRFPSRTRRREEKDDSIDDSIDGTGQQGTGSRNSVARNCTSGLYVFLRIKIRRVSKGK